jgi:hypothetical protein
MAPRRFACPAPAQAATGAAGEIAVAGEAPATQTPATAVSCEDLCRASMNRPQAVFQADCSNAGEGCCSIHEGPNGDCYGECMTMVSYNCGRRPSGLLRPRRRKKAAPEAVVGAYLAGAAELEAASITAFDILANELEEHGAPAGLTAAAQKSREDERRHTRRMAALAKRFGGEFKAPRVRPRRPRPLRAMALENAVEGCVREAFGALVATYQAAHAGDPSVRRAMRSIAIDETSHAALAFRVATWLDGRLDARAARSVRASMKKAGAALLREASAPVHPALVRDLGLPRPEAAAKMAQDFLAALDLS